MNLDRHLAWLWSRPPALATALLTGLLAVAPGAQDPPRGEPSLEFDDETPPTTPEILGTQESSPPAFEARLSALLGLRFLSDRDARPAGGMHPVAHLWDNGEDAISELRHILTVRQHCLAHFGPGLLRDGEPLTRLDELLKVPMFKARWDEAVAKDPGLAEDPEKQSAFLRETMRSRVRR